MRIQNGNSGERLSFGDAEYAWLAELSDDILTLHGNNGLIFSTSGQTANQRMRINQSGDVFVNEQLSVGDNPTNFGNVILQVGTDVDDARAARFRNNSPFNSTSFATLYVENLGNGIAIESANSDCRKPNGGEWIAASDSRLKQDIKDYNDGLEQLRKVRPVTFRYNDKTEYNTETTYVGIIAQDLQKIAPYMVNDKEEYLAIDGSAFKYMLINAVQEQDQTIQDQQKEIDELKARLDRIEALLKK